jgi:hypothetical protein
MSEKESYFGNTVTDEEAKLLATIPKEEARKLAAEILERNRKKFPHMEKRFITTADDFIQAFNRDPNSGKNQNLINQYTKDHREELDLEWNTSLKNQNLDSD